MAIAGEACARARIGERIEIALIELSTLRQILQAFEGTHAPCRHEPLRPRLREPLREPQSEPQGRLAVIAPFERALPIAFENVDRPHLDAVCASIAHQLRGRIKAHRQAVEQRAGEDRGLVTLDPCRCIGEQSEARGVRVMDNEIVRQEIVIAINLKIIGLLTPESFDLSDPVPIDIRARQECEIARAQTGGKAVDYETTKSTLVGTL